MTSDQLLCIASLSLGGLVWLKQYRFFTVLEYLVLAAMFISGASISFSIFQSAKVMVSLIVFVMRNVFSKYTNLDRIQYFIGSWKNPCHTSVAVADTAYHYHFPAHRGATSTERSCYLVPGKHPKSASKLQIESFWAPCVGFALHAEESEILQNLDNCGKCHDWSTVAVYLLSRDKFLTYSSVMYMRWLTFISVTFNVFCHGMWALVTFYNEQEYGARTSTASAMFGLYAFTIVDMLHMLVVAFDVCNFAGSRIEFNDKKSLATFGTHVAKFALLLLLTCAYLSCCPAETRWFGYYIYLALCVFSAVVVHYSVAGNTSKKAQPKRKEQHKDQRMPSKQRTTSPQGGTAARGSAARSGTANSAGSTE